MQRGRLPAVQVGHGVHVVHALAHARCARGGRLGLCGHATPGHDRSQHQHQQRVLDLAQVVRLADMALVGGVGRHQLDALVFPEAAVDHAHQHHHAHVAVEPAVDDHGAQRRVGVAARRGHLGDDGLEDVVDAHAGLGGTGNRVGSVDADHVLDLLAHPFRLQISPEP